MNSILVWNDPWIPAKCPRPARCKGNNYYQSLTVNQLIDPLTRTWNLNLLNAIVVPEDVSIIQSILVCGTLWLDSLGWHCTQSWKFVIKSGYSTEQDPSLYGSNLQVYGPDFRSI